ncbi:MAG: PEP-CTERM sorting domain-containing protein, partial [Moorea sp. SIO4A3]|nr:PEP-CTERM sorting domain-containing protein [Moorena sp. SIO4A3]
GKVPEPATILGLSVLGASLLLGKKKGSSQNA